MYLPRHFEEDRLDVLHGFVQEHPFGLLVTRGDQDDLVANGIPFLLDAGGSAGLGTLRGHVARANPVWHEGGNADALIVFQGPHGYVSPAWYPSKAVHGKVVPTWNYMIVQARGRLRAVEDRAWLRAFVARLTDRHEASRTAPWTLGEAPDSYVQAMLEAIVGVEIEVTSILGKWKLSQNRSAADRDGVVAGLRDPAEAAASAGDALALAAAISAASAPVP